MTAQKIIIDADPGVDDMLAILLMLAAPNIDALAVTTVAGNADIQNVTNNARFILQLASDDTSLYSGASRPLKRKLTVANVHGASGLDGVNVSEQVELDGRAVDKILEIVRSNPGEISLLILGPETNIAQAILREPDTMKRAKQFVIMGGAFDVPGNKNMVAEFNIAVDPEAAAIVADFPVPKTYIPLDICNKIQVPIEGFERIDNTKIRKTVVSALRPYIRNINNGELKTNGALMYDVLAAYYLLFPEKCETGRDNVKVETRGKYTYGMTLIDKRPIKERVNPQDSYTQLVTSIDSAVFVDDFFVVFNSKK